MGLLDRFRENKDQQVQQLAERNQELERYMGGAVDTIEMYKERLYELELALDDEGWMRLGFEGEREFSREGLAKIINMSRIMKLKNPIIGRAVDIRSFYVWGQGVEIKGRADDVNAVIQDFKDDIGNQRELFSVLSRTTKDQKLATEGNIFFVLDTQFITGTVNLRSLPVDEIDDIIVNPDDRVDVWYYKRTFTQKQFDEKSGQYRTKQRTYFYPDYYYALQRMNDKRRPSNIGGKPVIWSQPVYHVKYGGLDDMRFGVPETYSSLDWARAYKSYLEDWASLVRAISMFAWKYTTKKNNIKATREKMTALTSPDGERPAAGSTFISGEDGNLVPINKSGATTTADDGKMLRLMVASGMHLPDTILSNDPQQGALATAKTLDRPTELSIEFRQGIWQDVIKNIVRYVLIIAVESPGGLQGSYNAATGKLTINTASETSNPESVDVIFPSVVVPDMKEHVESIIAAFTLDGKQPADVAPDKLFRQLLLTALGVQDIDEVMEAMEDVDITPIIAPDPSTTQAQAEATIERLLEAVTGAMEKANAA